MSSHQIQFQPGMSIPEFLTHFGTEAQCADAIRRSRWADGFRCPRCAGAQHYVVGHGARKLFQCGACRHQTSLTAGTLMEHTKLPLTTWFLAIHLISQAKTGISALALKRDLGVSYPTAWLLHHKINTAMAHQEAAHRLDGFVQLDDAYLGGERSGGKVGRGSENKVPFVAAVSLNAAGQPMRLKLDLVKGFTCESISRWAKASVVGALKPRHLPEFKWINTMLGNLKTTLAGAFKALKFRKYAQTYLAAFAYRFNQRFDLRGLIATLIVDVAKTRPVKEKVIRDRHAEARF
jgi:hypothetical protein